MLTRDGWRINAERARCEAYLNFASGGGREIPSETMSVIVVITESLADWTISGRGFARLLDAAFASGLTTEDTQVLQLADANHGLFLPDLAEPQRSRLAAELRSAASRLRLELISNEAADDWDRSAAGHLSRLEILLGEALLEWRA